MEIFSSYKKRAATVTLVLLICSAGCSSVLAQEIEDQLLYLSWSKYAVVDTLVVSGAGEHDCFLLLQESQDAFYSFWSYMFISDGVEILSLEGVNGNDGIFSLTEFGEVYVALNECVSLDGLVPVAVFRVAINPSNFWSSSGGFIVPAYYEGQSSGNTQVVFGLADCSFGVLFDHQVRPVAVLDGSVPVHSYSFDGVKALYR